jgi:ABC-type multidrug transport system fused ATPase/permease subunit
VVPPTGVVVVACTDSSAGVRLADRLGRYVDAPVSLGGALQADGPGTAVPLAEFSEETVRRHVLVVDPEATLFGTRLAEELDPAGRCTPEEVRAALAVADAEEIVDDLPEGLDTVLGERGRSLSGGQRQRIVLARALLADPDVLVLVEPTSAVDAHTEARIADRLRTARAGRATVVVSASPLLMHAADRAVLVHDGTVVVDGTRHDVAQHPAYRAAVDRGGAATGLGLAT